MTGALLQAAMMLAGVPWPLKARTIYETTDESPPHKRTPTERHYLYRSFGLRTVEYTFYQVILAATTLNTESQSRSQGRKHATRWERLDPRTPRLAVLQIDSERTGEHVAAELHFPTTTT